MSKIYSAISFVYFFLYSFLFLFAVVRNFLSIKSSHCTVGLRMLNDKKGFNV